MQKRFPTATILLQALLIFLYLTLADIGTARSQNITLQKRRQVDSLFRESNNNSPGCVVAIVRDDLLIFAKGYGMANLEYKAANRPATLYDIGSVSKQFTAFCIMLLVQQHKLTLDDDVHQYIPWLLIKDRITIRHLLHHTSGIREYFQLLAIAGKSMDDAFTQQLAIHILKGQQTLNNKPGDRYLYSNSNYLLLAEIIKKISGQTLKQFADSAIFRPLGMTMAYVSDDYTEIQPNRAYSYQSKDNGQTYTKAFATDADVGAGNIFCSATDMAKWVINFYKTIAGDSATIAMLTQKGMLNNGKQISYAAGINVGEYKGWTLYEHEGESGGFNTCVSVFPDLKMGFIVFANYDIINAAAKNFALADLFLPAKEMKQNVTSFSSALNNTGTDTDTAFVQKYIGNAASDDGVKVKFAWKDNKFYLISPNDSEVLIQSKQDTFYQASQPDKKFVFATILSGAKVADEYSFHHTRRFYITSSSIDGMKEKELALYEGTYYCPELDCNYHIRLHDLRLWLSSNLYDDTPVVLDGNADAFVNFDWMSHLHFLYNEQQQIAGFEVVCSRVLGLIFKKVK